MNLLFVLPAYEPAWAFGGVVRCTSSLCRGLVGLGHQVTVYTTNADGKGRALEVPKGSPRDQGGVLTYFFPSTFGSGSVFDSRVLVGRLRRTVRQFDLVYLSAIWQWLGLSTSIICNREHVPLVMGTHGSFDKILRQRHWLRKTLYWHLFLKKAMSQASAIHFTTEYERQENADLLSEAASFIVPNGLDCSYFRPRPETRTQFRERYDLGQEVPLVITVARSDPKKRIDLLIRALSQVSEIYLLVVGPREGDLTASWKNLAQQLQVADRVIWTGHLEGEELLQAYSAADMFSLVSEDENFGMVVVEAMACGIPILVNPEVAVWEEVKALDVGMGVNLEADAIARALADFVHHRALWLKRGRNSLEVAHQFFDREKVAALMARAFEDVLSGNRTPTCRWEGLQTRVINPSERLGGAFMAPKRFVGR
jgi:glycosyltransferase involved in cell wall biosynthesis